MLRRLVSLIALALALPVSLCAQWTKLYTFPSPVDAIYFEDQIGNPSTGFAGLINGDIWKTTDNGVTWTKMTIGVSGVQDVVQIVFRNSSQGWAAPRNGPLLTTTDGGLNWSSTSLNNPGLGWVSVAYCASSGIVAAVDRASNDYKSTDLGTNWSTYGSPARNGASFSGNLGITASYDNSQPILYSTDGGATWANPSNGPLSEMWSPYLIPGTAAGLSVSEVRNDVWRTNSGGQSWTAVYSFTGVTLTGCVMGTTTSMFVQTTSKGFYVSSDMGSSWTAICGPSAAQDSRFYTRGKEIFAGESNSRSIWYNPDGARAASGTLSLDKATLTMKGVRCRQIDSMIRIQLAGTCVTGQLVKAQILKGAPAFSVNSVLLPKAISGKDSIAVNYMPSKALADTGLLLLEFLNGGVTVDTLITLYGAGVQSVSYYHDANINLYSPYACTERDSFVIVTNRSCDTLSLTAATLSDSTRFQIVPHTLPALLAPNASDTIFIKVSSRKDGTFQSLLRLQLFGVTGTIRDSVPLRFDVSQGAMALFSTLSLQFPDRCLSLDTNYAIGSTACDSLRLLLASLLDTTVFRMGQILIPTTIPAGGAINIPIHVIAQPKGSYSTQLHVRYLSGQRLIDTTITLSLDVATELPVVLHYSSGTMDLGEINVPCGETFNDLWIRDSLCRDMQITSIALDPPDPDYSLDVPTLPTTLHNYGFDSMRVRLHFKPTRIGTFSHNIRVTMRAEDGRTIDTVIPVYSSAVSEYKDTLLTPLLQFDTLLQCGQQELVGSLVNLSCDSVRIFNALFKDTANFQILSPGFPQTLGNRDTLHVRFRLKPSRAGALADSVTLLVHDPADGKDYPKRIALTAFVRPIVHRDSINAIAFSHVNIAPCGSALDSVTIANLGTCEDIIINSLDQLGYGGFVFSPQPTLPIVLHPGDGTTAGDSIRLYFTVTPPVDSTAKTQIHVKGINIDTLLNVTYASVPGAHKMEFTATDSVFPTRQCINVSRHYVIGSKGCSDVTIDSAMIASGITGQTQFTITGLPKLPIRLKSQDTLGFDVTFDPDGVGDHTGTLGIYSTNGVFVRRIPLAAAVSVSLPHTQIAILGSDNSRSLRSRPGTPVAVKVITVGAIGDTCKLQSISFDLRYNWNLLTPGNATFATGWTSTDNTEDNAGLLTVTMHHDVNASIPDSTVLATIPFTTTLGDSTWTDIQIANVRINDGDTAYARCVLAASAIRDSVHYETIDSCGSFSERGLINGITTISRVGLHPNPATPVSGHSRTALTMTLSSAATLRVTVRDMLGREFVPQSYEFDAGERTVDLDLPQASEGAYFVTVEAQSATGTSRLTRKLLIQAQ